MAENLSNEDEDLAFLLFFSGTIFSSIDSAMDPDSNTIQRPTSLTWSCEDMRCSWELGVAGELCVAGELGVAGCRGASSDRPAPALPTNARSTTKATFIFLCAFSRKAKLMHAQNSKTSIIGTEHTCFGVRAPK